MLTAELITEYHIDAIYDRVAQMDNLFSDDENDPIGHANFDAIFCGLAEDKEGNKLPYDVVVAICPNGCVVTQIIVFRNMGGYEKYLRDGIVIFDDRGL